MASFDEDLELARKMQEEFDIELKKQQQINNAYVDFDFEVCEPCIYTL